MITEQQLAYLALYQSGCTQKEIASKYGVNKSTVSRVLKRALRKTCPFSPDCRKCPLPECAFKDEYAMLVNNTENGTCVDGRRTNQYA